MKRKKQGYWRVLGILLTSIAVTASGCGGDSGSSGAGAVDGVTEKAIQRFMDSKDVSEFVAIGKEGAEQMVKDGTLESSEDDLHFTAEGLDLIFREKGALDAVTVSSAPYNLYGIEIGDEFDIFEDGKELTENNMSLVYDGEDAIVYAITDENATGGDRAATFALEDGRISTILYITRGGATLAGMYEDYDAGETMDEGLEEEERIWENDEDGFAADSYEPYGMEGQWEETMNSSAVAVNYRPGMRVDGVYVYDNGSDAVCTADVNLGQGYISVECTGYSGRGLYAYESYDCQENDTGDYTVSSEYGSFVVTFTDGGLYMADISAGGSAMNASLEGYYQLETPYDPSQVAGVDFPNTYIFPDSGQRALTQEDVSRIGSIAFLRYAKNEIYARHGRCFTSPELDAYFKTKNWYNGIIPADRFDESVLSQVEKSNVQLIQEYIDMWY